MTDAPTMDPASFERSTYRGIATSLLYHARAHPAFRHYLRQALGDEENQPLSNQCETFAATLYEGNRRAAGTGESNDVVISDIMESGTLYPEDVPLEDIHPEKTRPDSVVRPALLMRLLGGAAQNSDLPDHQTLRVEAAVARLVLDR